VTELEWMFVTGAGASARLGNDPSAPIPQMGGWATALTAELDRSVPLLAHEIGLRRDMPPEEFEAALGRFLAWSLALPVVERLKGAGVEAIGRPDESIDRFFATAGARARQATGAIHRVLFDLFGRQRINGFAASEAYGKLFEAIGRIHRSATVAFATTNYDVSVELALPELGLEVETGELVRPVSTDRVLRLDKILDAVGPGTTPLFYLHGRVGWYANEQRGLVAMPADLGYQEHLGAPAILLPDPNKDYSLFSFTEEIWRQFREALAAAHHVLVLGHSLNDSALVKELRQIEQAKLGVTTYPKQDRANPDEVERIRDLLPHCHLIPMDFGPEPQFDSQALRQWCDVGPPMPTEALRDRPFPI